MLTLQLFRDRFNALTNGWDWKVSGFVDSKGYVYPIDTDTKVLSTVFERIANPVIRSIAAEQGYVVELANQTTYPDFTLTRSTGTPKHRIAIDIKTTYQSTSMGFTLGGYNSFLRNNTKNILYPYDSYSDHWIVGYIYVQARTHPPYTLDNMPKVAEVACPYENVLAFIRAKHEITGLRAGSGNTKNIGSIKLVDAKSFRTALGPFSEFADPKGACDHYWRHYEKYSALIATKEQLKAHKDFKQFL